MRKGRHASTRGQPRGQIKEAVSIRERPPEAEDRAVPGHWEGDLLAGSRNTHVATLVEGSSRFVIIPITVCPIALSREAIYLFPHPTSKIVSRGPSGNRYLIAGSMIA